MARTIGASGNISLAIAESASDTFNPMTSMAFARRTTDGSHQAIISFQGSGGTTIGHFGVGDTNNMSANNQGVAFDGSSGPTVTASDGWCLLAWRKSTGSGNIRFTKIPLLSLSPTHTNGSVGSFTAWTAPTGGVFRIGNNSFSEPWQGDIAAVAHFTTDLTDAQVESCAMSLTTWLMHGPRHMWVLDQSATTMKVVDWCGTSNESSLSSTSISSSSPLFSYGTPILPAMAAPSGAASTNANAGNAAGTGTAYNPTTAGSTAAGNAAGTGTAHNPTTAGTASAGNAAGTGTAYNPTANTSGSTNANAGNAAGTGTAYNPTTAGSITTGQATGTGTAYNPATAGTATASNAAGTGTAYNPQQAGASIVGNAAGTGTAYNAVANTSGATNAQAGHASGTGTAYNPTLLAAALLGQATGTGTAYSATANTSASTNANAGNAAGTGTAYGPKLTIAPCPLVAAGVGAAYNPEANTGAKYAARVTITWDMPGVAIGWDQPTTRIGWEPT